MTDETTDETERTAASAERIAQLEAQVDRLQEQVDTLTPDVSRRQALQGGAAVGVGALLGGGATLGATRSARAAPDADDVGTPSDHVDVYVQNAYDVDGNQYDRFSELGFIEDSNSPYSSGTLPVTYQIADAPTSGVTEIFIEAKNSGQALRFQMNGVTSGYRYEGLDIPYSGGDSSAIAINDRGGGAADFATSIRLTYRQSGLFAYQTEFARGTFFHSGSGYPESITFIDNGADSIKKMNVYHTAIR